jgi:hypothetical protein
MSRENIGRKGQLRRAAWGAAMFLVAAGLATWLILTDQPRAWRLFLFVPLWMAGLGLLQAKEKT